MALHRTALPRHTDGARWEGLALAADGPDRPPLRCETADGRRLTVVQGADVVLPARRRATRRGVHYARTGRYVSPLPALRAGTARAYREACPDDDAAWSAR
ncbi:hypothetical protein GCM10010211_52360 [Streptomyces albospinus]|uniref:Uncharacterized protein n=1 Tax=Streptomyces albospinus TaxID=285515 RepID=A0ABQ2VCC4_9ACTN|nr:hypothetical protein [Streptomyces albospinus]GGU79840.1 hypothetical protein GCM10010211_52360 [Streptomyces albospinus]